MDGTAPMPEPQQIGEQLDRILGSKIFLLAQRSRAFLRYSVEQSLQGDAPKEYAIAVDVLSRSQDYDPSIDATVRVEAGRLRGRLREYYDTEGKHDPILIEIPKGGYAAQFTLREASSAEPVPELLTQLPPDGRAPASNLDSLPELAPANVSNSRIDFSHTKKQHWIASAVLIAACAVLGTWFIQKRLNPIGPIRSIAVLPLSNLSGDPNQNYFADGMTDALISELAQIPELHVVSRTSSMQEKGNTKPIRQIASELNVDAVVEGSVVRSGDRVRITAQLIDARNGRNLWVKSFEEQMSDILALQDMLAREIASQARVAIAPNGSGKSAHIKPDAYDAYLRGLYFLNQRDTDKSAEYFQQAVNLDPTYAPSYAGLAQALAQQVFTDPDKTMAETMPPALAAVKRALELNPMSGEAYTARASIETIYQVDWTAAGRDLEHALSLNPNDPVAGIEYVIYLDNMGRTNEAVDHMRRVLSLDPLSFRANRHMGSALYFARRYDESLFYLSRASELEKLPSAVENWSTRDYEMLGRFDESVRADLLAILASKPDANVEPLRIAYQQGGWKAYQVARAALLKPLATIKGHSWNGAIAYELGLSYLRTGDRAQAIPYFEYAADQHCFWSLTMKVDPVLDDLRSDPHYPELLARVHATP
jgi:TolB-like protein/Flp pilus assembly protein TadD